MLLLAGGQPVRDVHIFHQGIQGPPGTGKTQTILNLAANLILNNRTVAICMTASR